MTGDVTSSTASLRRSLRSRRGFLSVSGAGLACLAGLGLPGCEKPASTAEVVVYTSTDDVYARAVTGRFTERSGIRVRLVTDTEETKSTGLLNRLIAEGSRPQADVFWSGDAMRAAILKQRDLADTLHSPELAAYPAHHRDPSARMARFSARLRVLLYHRGKLGNGALPTSIRDLVDPRFRNQACIANPLFGTTSMHAAALFESWGDTEARAFFAALQNNGVRMLASNGEVRRRVASGEFTLGLTDSDDANVALLDGKPVGFVLPDQDSFGTLLIPSALVALKSGPNPDPARQFIDFLLSEEGEQLLAASSAAQIPLRTGLPTPPFFGRALADIRLMSVDPDALGRRLTTLQDGFLRDWVSIQMSR